MLKRLSPERRQFVRRHRQRIRIIVILAVINLITAFGSGGDFTPWFLIPAVFIALPMIQDFVDTLLGKEDEDEDEEEVEEETATETAAEPPVASRAASRPSLASPTIQAHLNKARTYRDQIEAFIRATADPHSQARLQDLSNQITDWMAAIEAMARRIDTFQQNAVIRQDLASVPQSIKKLETQLASETDATIRAELERTLLNRKHQWAALQRLQNTMKQAEIKIESTLASLGTIYSQLLTSQSTDHVADYGRLSAEVNEEVRTLQDHLEALEEVKLGRG
ncbi:MAG: hypothetical protein JXM69_11070 [Anaerolineae bacterium]|nr:hypothetical protein [Anaerolineae bacterium]